MKAVRWGAGVVGEILVTAGLVLLLFVAWQLWWTDLTANHEQSGTISALEKDFAHGGTGSTGSTGGAGGPGSTSGPGGTGAGSVVGAGRSKDPAQQPVAAPSVAPGQAFAIIRIPRFGTDYARPVLEGTDHDVLQQGVGHYAGTALPGQLGNFAVAGHRTTYGRPFHDIDTLVKGDRIVIETQKGYFVYAVQSHEIVEPTDVAVIAPVPDHPGREPGARWLTLTACHPKYSAQQRYIVHASLVGTYARATGLPGGVLAAPGK